MGLPWPFSCFIGFTVDYKSSRNGPLSITPMEIVHWDLGYSHLYMVSCHQDPMLTDLPDPCWTQSIKS
eukprot:2238884-Prorocentrum_lima.AAC.1